MCVCVFTCEFNLCNREEGVGSSGYELSNMSMGVGNSGPLEEQEVMLTNEPSVQLPILGGFVLRQGTYICNVERPGTHSSGLPKCLILHHMPSSSVQLH